MFSDDPDSKHYKGVALIFRKSSFWKVTRIQWPAGNPCATFSKDGRLIASQAFFGNGGSSIVVYHLYAPSGSRWEEHKKRLLHQMLDAIQGDCVIRGQLPYFIMGDFNMPIAESTRLTAILQNQTIYDVRQVAAAENLNVPTCHVGPSQGSCIDHIFVSGSLIDNMFNFEVKKTNVFKDHSV